MSEEFVQKSQDDVNSDYYSREHQPWGCKFAFFLEVKISQKPHDREKEEY